MSAFRILDAVVPRPKHRIVVEGWAMNIPDIYDLHCSCHMRWRSRGPDARLVCLERFYAHTLEEEAAP